MHFLDVLVKEKWSDLKLVTMLLHWGRAPQQHMCMCVCACMPTVKPEPLVAGVTSMVIEYSAN